MNATSNRYTNVAIILHWLIAAAIIFQMVLGWRLGDAPKGATTYALFQLHKSIGFTILFLSLARLAWRFMHTPLPSHMKAWEKTAPPCPYQLLCHYDWLADDGLAISFDQ